MEPPTDPSRSVSRRGLLAGLAATPLVGAAAGAGTAPDPAAVQDAVDSARSYLLAAQEDGHWASAPSMGVDGRWDARINAYYALALEHLGVNEESKRAAVDWLLDQREPAGGWNDLNANYAALSLFRSLGEDRYGDVIEEIERANERQGFSLVDPDRSFGEALGRGVLRVQLLHLLTDDRYDREELFPPDATERFLGLLQMTAAFDGDEIHPTEEFVHQPFVDLTLAAGNLLANTEPEPSEAAGNLADLTEDLLLQRRAPNGVWSMSIDNIFAVFALAASGYDAGDPEIRRALDYLAETWQLDSGRLVPWKLPVFDTGWVLDALRASGLDPDHDAMTDAAQWLYEARIASPMSKREDLPLDFPRPRPPFREHWAAGWGYKPHTITDWDDTAAALYGWSPYEEHVVAEEVQFLRDAQRSNGCWGTWHKEEMEALDDDARAQLSRRFDEEDWQYLAWLFEDPESVDITGHALMALGEYGDTVENSETARRAVEWLLDNREDGLWRSPRDPGYVYGTTRALLGLAAVDADLDRPEVQAAISGLLDRQRDDGSWGEPDIAPVQTARAINGLLAAGVPSDHPAVERGIRFLLETQNEDGSWEFGRFMVVLSGYPYTLSLFGQASALKALSRYADAEGIPYEPDADAAWLGLSGRDRSVGGVLAALVALVSGLLWKRNRE